MSTHPDPPASKSPNQLTLTEWTDRIRDHQQEPLPTPCDCYLRLGTVAGKVSEDVRRSRYHQVMVGATKCFIELIQAHNSVVDRLLQQHLLNPETVPTLEQSIFDKFPRRCSTCGQRRCECFVRFVDHEDRTTEEQLKLQITAELSSARRDESPPETLDAFGSLFQGIYSQGHRYMRLDDIGFHLLEEIGEIAECLLALSLNSPDSDPLTAYQSFCSEIGDAISWIFALRAKAAYIIQHATPGAPQHDLLPSLSESLDELLNGTNPLGRS